MTDLGIRPTRSSTSSLRALQTECDLLRITRHRHCRPALRTSGPDGSETRNGVLPVPCVIRSDATERMDGTSVV